MIARGQVRVARRDARFTFTVQSPYPDGCWRVELPIGKREIMRATQIEANSTVLVDAPTEMVS